MTQFQVCAASNSLKTSRLNVMFYVDRNRILPKRTWIILNLQGKKRLEFQLILSLSWYELWYTRTSI